MQYVLRTTLCCFLIPPTPTTTASSTATTSPTVCALCTCRGEAVWHLYSRHRKYVSSVSCKYVYVLTLVSIYIPNNHFLIFLKVLLVIHFLIFSTIPDPWCDREMRLTRYWYSPGLLWNLQVRGPCLLKIWQKRNMRSMRDMRKRGGRWYSINIVCSFCIG